MFDVSFGELLVVVFLFLFLVNPKDLPKIMRYLGQLVGRAKRYMNSIMRYFDEVVREAEVRQDTKETSKDKTSEKAPTTTIAGATEIANTEHLDEDEVYPPDRDIDV